MGSHNNKTKCPVFSSLTGQGLDDFSIQLFLLPPAEQSGPSLSVRGFLPLPADY